MSGWTQIPNFLWDRDDLTIYDRGVLMQIVRKTIGWGKQTDGISLSQFEKSLGVSKPTIIKSLNALIGKKIISKLVVFNENGGQSFNRYSLSKNIVESANNDNKKVVKEIDRGSKGDLQGVVKEIDRGSKGDLHTKETRQKKLEQERKKSKKEFLLPPEINQSAWSEFEQHRKEIRKPLSDLARTKSINLINHLTYQQQQQVIDYSIQGRYQGLFLDCLNKRKNNSEPKTFSQIIEERNQDTLNVLFAECDREEQQRNLKELNHA